MKPVLWWLLTEYCHDNGIDVQELDKTLEFGENMDLLTRRFGRLKTPGVYKRIRPVKKR